MRKRNSKQKRNRKDKKEKHKSTSNKKKQSKKESRKSMADEFLARQRRQAIIFVTSIIFVASTIFSGYYLYETQWTNGEGETNFDNTNINLESDNNERNIGGNYQTE